MEFVTSSKFLGVIIDDKIKFNEHIQGLCNKISKSIGIIFRIRNCIPNVCLRILYFCLVHPYFLYCLPVFGATYDTHLQPLILLQKRAIRLISNAAFLANTEPLFKMQKILKFNDIYKHSIACYMFKNQHLLHEFVPEHTHFTRYRNLLVPPFERLRSTSQSVIHNGVSACGIKYRMT